MQTNGFVRVVNDQLETRRRPRAPLTWGHGFARAIWRALELGLHGTHYRTEAGIASWYDFAVAIAEEASATSLLRHRPIVASISTNCNPIKVHPLSYSVLEQETARKSIVPSQLHCRVHLRLILKELIESGELTCHA